MVREEDFGTFWKLLKVKELGSKETEEKRMRRCGWGRAGGQALEVGG